MSHFFRTDNQGIICAELSSSSDPGGVWIEAPHGQVNLSGRTYNAETGLGPELAPKKADYESALSQKLREFQFFEEQLKINKAKSSPDKSIAELSYKVDNLWDDYQNTLKGWADAE